MNDRLQPPAGTPRGQPDVLLRMEYRHSVLPPAVSARVLVGVTSPLVWDRFVGQRCTIIGTGSLGFSVLAQVVEVPFGFDVAHVVAATRKRNARHPRRAEGSQ